LTFTDDDQLGAQAGCNHLGGSVSLEGGALDVRALAMTEVGCPENRMRQDECVSRFLCTRPAYEVDGAQLVLTGGGTSVTLVDEEAESPDRALVGTTWRLEGIVAGSDETGAVSSVAAGVRSTLRIADGRVGLRPGCNRAGGEVEVDEDTVTFGRMFVTLMDCWGAKNQVERTVLGILDGPVAWTIDDDTLTLRLGATSLLYRAVG